MDEPALPFTVVHIASGDLWAGAEMQLHTLACNLRRSGAQLHVIVLNHGELERRLRAEGVPVSVFDEAQLCGAHILFRTVRLCRALRPRVIHSHRVKENVLAALAARFVRGCRSVRTTHGAPEHAPAWWRLHKQLPRLLDRMAANWLQARVVAVSEELALRLAAKIPRRRLTVIENGIDIDAVREASRADIDLPRRPGIARVVLVGRLVAIKRVDLFVAAACQVLAAARTPVEFLIYGDGPLRAALEARIATSGWGGDRLRLVGFRNDMPAHLAAADLLLITSDHEGLPMVLLEALALELPVVTHAVGGMPEVLDHGQCGTLVHQQTPEAYAAAVHRLLEEPAPFRASARRGLERLRRRYSAAANAARYLELYRELAN